jgi:hypothetical protein
MSNIRMDNHKIIYQIIKHLLVNLINLFNIYQEHFLIMNYRI